ncbi:MAG: P-loop NTPase fold protein [Planctomycetota bacterium]|nr:P-loop NTPase fold protein [Planctomycetota bacterium]
MAESTPPQKDGPPEEPDPSKDGAPEATAKRFDEGFNEGFEKRTLKSTPFEKGSELPGASSVSPLDSPAQQATPREQASAATEQPDEPGQAQAHSEDVQGGPGQDVGGSATMRDEGAMSEAQSVEQQVGGEVTSEVGAISAEEVSELSTWSQVALAARSALRVLPTVVLAADAPPEVKVPGYATTEAAVFGAAIAASAAGQDADIGVSRLRLLRAGLKDVEDWAVRSLGITAISQAVAAAEAAAEGDAHLSAKLALDALDVSAGAAFSATDGLPAARHVARSISFAAARADVGLLRQGMFEEDDEQRRRIAWRFFERPLWIGHSGVDLSNPLAPEAFRLEQGIPEGWDKVVTWWRAALRPPELLGIFERYEAMLEGKGIERSEIVRVVAAWAEKYGDAFPALRASSRTKSASGTAEIRFDAKARAETAPLDLTGVPTLGVDRPAKEDRLGRKSLIDALAAMFDSNRQDTPFTLALLGDWGAGKTSVMSLVQDELRKRRPGGRFAFVWFNAWRYENTDSVPAGLAQEVLRGIEADASYIGRWCLRGQFAWSRLHRVVGRLLWLIVFLLVAAHLFVWLVPSVVVAMFGQLTTLKVVGLAGVIGAIGVIYRIVDEFVAHPATRQFADAVNLPKHDKELGLLPVLRGQIESACAFRLGSGLRRWFLWLGKHQLDRKFWSDLANKDAIKRVRATWLGRRLLTPRRLIVWIDDLDRCGQKAITQALDAVRLVMDLPHVIVCIAIDHRIAFRAVEEQYAPLADETRSKRAIARDYLGKIIQLPIRLERPTPESLHGFVESRLFPDTRDGDIDPGREPIISDDAWAETRAVSTDSAGDRADRQGADQRPDSRASGEGRTDDAGQDTVTDRDADSGGKRRGEKSAGDDAANAEGREQQTEEREVGRAQRRMLDEQLQREMTETTGERGLFEDLAGTHGFANPRSLSRLRNTYRLLKLLDARRPGGRQFRNETLLRMMFWQEYLYSAPEEERRKHEHEIWSKPLHQLRLEADDWRDRAAKLRFDMRRYFDALSLVRFKEVRVMPTDRELYDDASRFVRRVILPYGEPAPPPQLEQQVKQVAAQAVEQAADKTGDGDAPAASAS